jgi:hypothetical protein
LNPGQTTTQYDPLLRAVVTALPNGAQISNLYRNPNQTGMTQPMGNGTTADTEALLDGYGRMSRVAIANGQASNPWYQTDYCYDATGRLQFKSVQYQGNGWSTPMQCSGSGTSYVYDALGRVTSSATPDGTNSTQYSGRAVETTSIAGVRRITQYDVLGRISAVCEISANGSMPLSGAPVACGMDLSGTGFVTTYAYNLAAHTTTITQGGTTEGGTNGRGGENHLHDRARTRDHDVWLCLQRHWAGRDPPAPGGESDQSRRLDDDPGPVRLPGTCGHHQLLGWNPRKSIPLRHNGKLEHAQTNLLGNLSAASAVVGGSFANGIIYSYNYTPPETASSWAFLSATIPQDLQQSCREHDIAILHSLALFDANDHPLTIDVRGLQVDGFGNARAGSVAAGQDRPMVNGRHAGEKMENFLSAENDRQKIRRTKAFRTSGR